MIFGWIFLLTLLIYFTSSLLFLYGWSKADERLEKAEKEKAALLEKNHALLEHTYKQQFNKELQIIKEWGDKSV